MTPSGSSASHPTTVRSVLIVTLTRRLGGAERMIAQLLEGLRDSTRLTLGLVRSEDPRPGTGASGWNARGENGPGETSEGRAGSGGGIPWRGPTVGLREILFGRFDIIHSHLFLPGLLIRMRRIWDGSFRWVHTVHYGEATYGSMTLGRFRRWLDHRLVYPHADRLVAVSPSIARELDGNPRTRIIENAIPLEPDDGEPDDGRPGDAESDDAGAVPSPVVVGTVAHLRREKGVDVLLEAVGRLKDRGRSVVLRIAGDGPEADALEGQARALGISDAVELRGFVHDLEPFYRSLDVYVQPSRVEAFGIAALESMRFSLPLVARSVGNLPRLLGDGEFGVLVDGGAAALADGMERAMDRRESYRARARRGLAHWRTRYDPDEMVRAHEALYREAVRPAVCMIAPVVTQAGGGIARQLHLQSRALARRGHAVYLVQRSDPELVRDPNRARRWAHVTVLGTGELSGTRAGPGGLFRRLRGAAFIAAGLFRLWQLRRRVDVLHAHQLHSPTLLGALGKRLLLVPLVTKVTSSGEMGESSELRRLPFTEARLGALRSVDRILVLTPHMEGEMRVLGVPRDRIRLVPNCVELPQYPEEPAAGGGEPSGDGSGGPHPFRLLFVGRISREKRLQDLLEAARILSAEGDAVEVDLVGAPDPDRDAGPDLRRMVEQWEADRPPDRAEHGAPPGTLPTVRFHGHHDDPTPFYRRADVFVLPSSTEGLSNALLEAMAHGLPSVVSDIPQNRWVVGDGGLCYSTGSPEELAGAVRRLLRDRNAAGELLERLSRCARERVDAEFSVESVVERLRAVYRDVTPTISL